jgi:uncharacterized protein YdaL
MDDPDARAARPHPAAGAVQAVMNRFPQGQGEVPQARGTDLRAAAELGAWEQRAAAFESGAGPSTLVLYDEGGPWGWLGELYGIAAGHLASRFGPWAAKPVSQYTAGELSRYRAAIYIGSTYDEPLPVAFLDDVLAGSTPVVWAFDNIWQLANRAGDLARTYGFDPWYFDTGTVSEVRYKGVSLTRHAANGAGIMVHSVLDPATASVLALAVRADGSTFPWAVRGRNLTYVGENPFVYISESDRYLAFCDLLFDVLAPGTPERHRALVRIEDVTPVESPAKLRAAADYLASQQIPFSVAVVPVYVDPRGVYNGGVPEVVRLREAPALVKALKYAISKGGTLVLHGYTHQYADVANPYTAVSADDFEFFTAHVNAQDYVVLDGPVPEDSAAWASDRIARALDEFTAADLPRPQVFEFPHYAASGVHARAVAASFGTAYHRGLYFRGSLTGLPFDTQHLIGQFYPFPVVDVYGWKVLPENLGSYEPVSYNNNPTRLVADIVASARAAQVVRDGVASFYWHPYHPVSTLKQIVAGIRQAGYAFVSPGSL